MGHKLMAQFGNVKVKMDTKDDIYYDAKDPHVLLEENGIVTVKHLSLSNVDDYVGRTSDEKKAIYWIRDKKEWLIEQYLKNNRR